jgi:hypothetical protein
MGNDLKKLFIFIMCWVIVINPAFSQAVPVSKMQSALSGIIQQKSLKRGFAANDPRYIGTLKDVSSSIAGTAAGAAAVTAAGITAPAWVTVAVAAGIGTLVTYAVSLAIDGITKWLFKTSTVDIPATNGQTSNGGPMVLGGPYWQGTAGNYVNGTSYAAVISGSDGMAVAMQASSIVKYATSTCTANAANTVVQCTLANGYPTGKAVYNASGAPLGCPGGSYASGSSCSTYDYPYPAPGATPAQTGVALPAAITAIPASDLAKPVNPDVLANVANSAWLNAAAKPGYSGLPYNTADPITPAEVSTWKDANPTVYPTVADSVAPQPTANSPWQLPVSPTATTQSPGVYPSTGTNPASANPLQNLGPDPGVGAPTLEDTPTADQILKPILNLLPDFKSFNVPSHAAECPKPVFHIFDKDFVMDSQCTIAESNRAAIQSLMAAVWIIIGVMIVLRA